MTRARSLKTAVLLAVAGTVLTGCGTHPGAAAVVGDTTISTDEVDAAARALCSANATDDPAAPALASRGARIAALQFLIDSELSRQFGASVGIEPDAAAVSETLAQNRAGIASIPDDRRDDFLDLLVGFRESELIVAEAGTRALEEQGAVATAPEQAASEGFRLRTEWAEDVDVEVDPRFGSYADGTLNPESGSLSVPASERATSGAQPDPGQDWVAGLPDSQKCA